MRSICFMNKVVVVCPILDEVITDICFDSILNQESSLGIPIEQIMVVDNSKKGFGEKYKELGMNVYRDPKGHNIGCARAWNLGVGRMFRDDLDYTVIMSSSMMFGPVLQTTFLAQMQTFWGSNVIEANGHGWHLIAFHRRVFEQIGVFDTNFYPAYFEDVDFGRRYYISQLSGRWENVWLNAISQGHGLHQKRGHVYAPATPLLQYYELKWGGGKGNEKFSLPFEDKPISYFPQYEIEELVEMYHFGGHYW